jgi:hypothetical protein
LLVVAALRLLSVALGYGWSWQLRDKVFAGRAGSKEYTALTGRTFAVWTAVTCLVCVITAFNLDNAPLMQLCVGTFVAALGYFALELLVYRTTTPATIASPFVVASEFGCHRARDGVGWAVVLGCSR